MHKTKKIFLIISVITIVCVTGLVWLLNSVSFGSSSVPDGYVVYNSGKVIDFSKDGNSRDFAPVDGAWGGQEPKHRCITAKTAELKLFVPDADGADMRLSVNAFGVYNPIDPCQYVTVYVNDTNLTKWCMANRDVYTVIIPAKLVKDGALHITFEIANPYVNDVDVRTLGAAVREIRIEKLIGQQTKKKLSLWLQKKIWGKPAENPYADENAQPEKSK